MTQAKALHRAQVNLERTRIVSQVDAHLTSLLAQLGDYVNVGVNGTSIADSDSYLIDGHFENMTVAPI